MPRKPATNKKAAKKAAKKKTAQKPSKRAAKKKSAGRDGWKVIDGDGNVRDVATASQETEPKEPTKKEQIREEKRKRHADEQERIERRRREQQELKQKRARNNAGPGPSSPDDTARYPLTSDQREDLVMLKGAKEVLAKARLDAAQAPFAAQLAQIQAAIKENLDRIPKPEALVFAERKYEEAIKAVVREAESANPGFVATTISQSDPDDPYVQLVAGPDTAQASS